MSIKCPFCGSNKIMRFQRDADWGGGSYYDTVNGEDNYTDLDTPDVEVYHCRSCESFFDPHHTFPELRVIPVIALGKRLENLEKNVQWLTDAYRRKCDYLRKITANTSDASLHSAELPRAVLEMQEAHRNMQQAEELCDLLRHILQHDALTVTTAVTPNLDVLFVSPSGLPPITEFQGEYKFLSNTFFSPVTYMGIRYPCVENAFQAQKTIDTQEQLKIAQMRPSYAKSYGKKMVLRDDWNKVKVNIMRTLLFNKFVQNPELAKKLVATKDAVIVNLHQYADPFWGMKPDGTGENNLGKLLMELREHRHIQEVAANG